MPGIADPSLTGGGGIGGAGSSIAVDDQARIDLPNEAGAEAEREDQTEALDANIPGYVAFQIRTGETKVPKSLWDGASRMVPDE